MFAPVLVPRPVGPTVLDDEWLAEALRQPLSAVMSAAPAGASGTIRRTGRDAPKRSVIGPAARPSLLRDGENFGGEVSRPRAATLPQRQAWLRIFVVGCG